jgi:putative addiction module component (TIGR02574 family)
MSEDALRARILAMSVDDRLELVTFIWNSIAEDTFPISEEHKLVLDERLKEYEANPTEGIPWDELHARLRNQK